MNALIPFAVECLVFCRMSDTNNAVPTLQKKLRRKDREKQREFELPSSTKKFQKLLSAATRPDDRETSWKFHFFTKFPMPDSIITANRLPSTSLMTKEQRQLLVWTVLTENQILAE